MQWPSGNMYDISAAVLQAHEKSVSAACFVNKGSTRFVTASDDMTIAVWDIMHRKDGLIVR